MERVFCEGNQSVHLTFILFSEKTNQLKSRSESLKYITYTMT